MDERMSRRAWLGAAAVAAPAVACGRDDAGAAAAQPGARVLDVREFGATGNGRDDDYPAVARALDTARKTGEYGGGDQGAIVFFPPGTYRVTRPLDCNGRQFNLVGAGPFQSTIRGDTGDGAAIIECIGRYCSFRDLLLDTRGMRNPSSVGLLVGRAPGGQSGDMHFQNLRVQMEPAPRANGGNGTVALYNVATEVQTGEACTFGADVGALFSAANVWGLRSRHGQAMTDGSMSVVSFTGANWFYGLHGPAIRMQAAAALHFDGFISSLAGTPQYPQIRPAPFAMEVLGSVTGLSWRGSMEGFGGVLRIHEIPVVALRLEGVASRTAAHPFIQLDGSGSIHSGSIDLAPTQDTNALETYLVDSGPSGAPVVANTHVWLRNQKVRLRGDGHFSHNLVIAQTPLGRAAAAVSAAHTDGNVILAADGVDAGGNRMVGAGPSARRPNPAAAGAGAQFYDTALRRPVWSDGAAWRDAMGNPV